MKRKVNVHSDEFKFKVQKKKFPLIPLIYADVFDSFCGNPRDLREYINEAHQEKISRRYR